MAVAALHRRRSRAAERGSQIVSAAIVGAGKVIGFAWRRSPVLPGLGGAALVSLGTGEIAGHVFGHGLAPWVGALVGGLFLLQIDRHTPTL